jgi:hypothetical protein
MLRYNYPRAGIACINRFTGPAQRILRAEQRCVDMDGRPYPGAAVRRAEWKKASAV